MITLGSLKHRQQQCSKHSTPNQAVGKDGRSGSRRNGGVSLEQETPSGGDGQDLDAGPVKISVSEMDKPDYIDMVRARVAILGFVDFLFHAVQSSRFPCLVHMGLNQWHTRFSRP